MTMNFCPRCASPLTTRHDGGRDRIACPDSGCGFIHFGDFSIGCAGVVIRQEQGVTKALLVQRGQNPFAGSWQIPGGYAEHDELLSVAVEREVEEESNVIARVRDMIAFRHALGGTAGGPSTNVYMIFRLEYESGEPQHDGDEIAAAGFFSFDEMDQMEKVQSLSRWGIEQALKTESGTGINVAGNPIDRPGFELYGLTDVPDSVWGR